MSRLPGVAPTPPGSGDGGFDSCSPLRSRFWSPVASDEKMSLLAVRGPHRVALVGGIGRQSARHAASDVDYPEVEAPLGILDLHHDASTVRRERDLTVLPRLAERAERLSVSVEPPEPDLALSSRQPRQLAV